MAMRESLRTVPFAIALVAFSWIFTSFFISVNVTESMPLGIYVRVPIIGDIREGDIIELRNPMPDGYMGMELGNTTLLKHVTAVSEDGSRLIVRGETPRSYDSRFFGPVDRSLAVARAYPLITESGPVGDHIISHLLLKEKEE